MRPLRLILVCVLVLLCFGVSYLLLGKFYYKKRARQDRVPMKSAVVNKHACEYVAELLMSGPPVEEIKVALAVATVRQEHGLGAMVCPLSGEPVMFNPRAAAFRTIYAPVADDDLEVLVYTLGDAPDGMCWSMNNRMQHEVVVIPDWAHSAIAGDN